MTRTLAAVLAALTLLGACATTDNYPVSGDQCGPTDPVKELDAKDCMPPV